MATRDRRLRRPIATKVMQVAHRKGERGVMRVLLAIDGSGHSEAAVDEIARQRFPAKSEVRVISVVATTYVPSTFPGEGASMTVYAEIEKNARERARAAVDKAEATLRADKETRRLNITTEVIFGSPKVVILEDAEAFGADLIVVGSHGHGALERFLLGSVAQAVVLHAACSVEIVRSRITRKRKSKQQ
jgi:nucleotide-binding universal stress UspA family protein